MRFNVSRSFVGTNRYISSNYMEVERTCGTDVEIFTFAHLLNTSIISYNISHERQLKSSPCYVDVTLAESDIGEMVVYINNSQDHFKVHLSVHHQMTILLKRLEAASEPVLCNTPVHTIPTEHPQIPTTEASVSQIY